ncbi:MAG: hypothetical protein WA003_17595, partial [Desulfuromonadaceae bacterium]
NNILQDFYASNGGAAMIDNFPAVKSAKHELFRDIGFLRDNKRVLVYDRAETKLLSVRMSDPLTAELLLYEDWNYAYQNITDRKLITRVKGIGHGFRYHLKRDRRGWIVVAWNPEEVKAQPQSDEFYF